MRICILGASGFIGGVLRRELMLHHSVTAPTRADLDLTNTNLVFNYFQTTQFDAVINCAGDTDSNLDKFNMDRFQYNISIVTNLSLAQRYFGRLINFGSGAEFDRRSNIFLAQEDAIWRWLPSDHYGMSKNITSRIVNGANHWYNLRLFGVFGATESPTRLLQRVIAGEPIEMLDKLFDYFYVDDIVPVVEYYLTSVVPLYKDINITYRHANKEKTLSQFVQTFCDIHSLPNPITFVGKDLDRCYTGHSLKLNNLKLPMKGLIKGLEEYK